MDFKKSFINHEQFPIVIEPAHSGMNFSECKHFLEQNREAFKAQLLQSGALLFRKFPVQDAAEFSDFISSLQFGNFIDYVGGDSPRNKIKGGVYTSTEAPPSLKIPLHNELSFVKNYPKHIYFFCETAPKAMGATTIADARKVYHAVDSAVKERLQEKGIKYYSSYYHRSKLMELINKFQRSHKSWPEVFETPHKQEVEQKCVENDFGFKWNRDDWIQINQLRPAFMEHPETQETVWFNQIHLYDFNPQLLGLWRYLAAKMVYVREHMRLHEVFYADESKIPREDIYHILDVLEEQTIRFAWQKGDVLVLDNVLSMHGRDPFEGKRRILAAMTS